MRLIAPLRAAPATVPALGALALMVVWASNQAGYPLTHWAPGGLIVLALLAIAPLAVVPRWDEIPLAVRIAVGCLAAYTALSFLSILWAGVPGDAWEGANRTLLYLLVFALFACWAQTGPAAALLLCGWVLAMVGVGLFVPLHIDAATSAARLIVLLPGGRLVYPAGYVNANAAQWLMACWPALLLARERRLPWWLRGRWRGRGAARRGCAAEPEPRLGVCRAGDAGAGVCAAPGPRAHVRAVGAGGGGDRRGGTGGAARGRTGGRAGRRPRRGCLHSPAALHSATAAVHAAVVATLLSALVVGAVVAAGAALECRRTLSPTAATRVHPGVAAVGLTLLVVLLAGGWAAAGDPVSRARHAWDTFKSPKGYAANDTTGSRLTSGLGSSRYDFYRVALDEFAAHPLLGIGADNFAESYLAHGRPPRHRAIRTVWRCARSCKPGCWGRCSPWSGWVRHCWRPGGCSLATPIHSRARLPRPLWRASPTGSCMARSTGSGSLPAWGHRPSRCSVLPCALAPRPAARVRAPLRLRRSPAGSLLPAASRRVG